MLHCHRYVYFISQRMHELIKSMIAFNKNGKKKKSQIDFDEMVFQIKNNYILEKVFNNLFFFQNGNIKCVQYPRCPPTPCHNPVRRPGECCARYYHLRYHQWDRGETLFIWPSLISSVCWCSDVRSALMRARRTQTVKPLCPNRIHA